MFPRHHQLEANIEVKITIPYEITFLWFFLCPLCETAVVHGSLTVVHGSPRISTCMLPRCSSKAPLSLALQLLLAEIMSPITAQTWVRLTPCWHPLTSHPTAVPAAPSLLLLKLPTDDFTNPWSLMSRWKSLMKQLFLVSLTWKPWNPGHRMRGAATTGQNISPRWPWLDVTEPNLCPLTFPLEWVTSQKSPGLSCQPSKVTSLFLPAEPRCFWALRAWSWARCPHVRVGRG